MAGYSAAIRHPERCSHHNVLVQTKKQYADFVLRFECKALKPDQWDSGVYFRYTSVPKGRPWPSRYQVNLRKGMEGNVGSFEKATSTGLFKPGEWNRFELTVRGESIALRINDEPAWKTEGIEVPKGYIALQAEIPHGGQFLFRKDQSVAVTCQGNNGPEDGEKLRAALRLNNPTNVEQRARWIPRAL